VATQINKEDDHSYSKVSYEYEHVHNLVQILSPKKKAVVQNARLKSSASNAALTASAVLLSIKLTSSFNATAAQIKK
jgi:hypothetical protein